MYNFKCPHCGEFSDLGREYFLRDRLRAYKGDFDVIFCTNCKSIVGTTLPSQLQSDLQYISEKLMNSDLISNLSNQQFLDNIAALQKQVAKES